METDEWTDRQTEGRYQVHYLPALLSYAVDNKNVAATSGILQSKLEKQKKHLLGSDKDKWWEGPGETG